jgi:hypothetical protein
MAGLATVLTRFAPCLLSSILTIAFAWPGALEAKAQPLPATAQNSNDATSPSEGRSKMGPNRLHG